MERQHGREAPQLQRWRSSPPQAGSDSAQWVDEQMCVWHSLCGVDFDEGLERQGVYFFLFRAQYHDVLTT